MRPDKAMPHNSVLSLPDKGKVAIHCPKKLLQGGVYRTSIYHCSEPSTIPVTNPHQLERIHPRPA